MVTRSGVYVVDTKNYSNKKISVNNGWLIGEKPSRLFLGTDENTELIPKLKEYQVKRIENSLRDIGLQMPVTGVLAFHKGKYHPIFWKPRQVDGVLLTPYGLSPIFNRKGPYSSEDIEKAIINLAKAFPAAT